MKLCTKCGETKAATEFSKDAAARDGLRPDCKACKRTADAARYAANPDKSNNLQKNAKHPVEFMQQRGFLL